MASFKGIDFKKQLAVSTANTLKNNKLISSENIKNNIVILDELKRFIPALNPDEYEALEQSIIANGCRTPLLIWNTTAGQVYQTTAQPDEPCFVLFDGHHRYEICQKHGIDFQIDLMSFASIEAVKDFMIDFQIGRRNMTPEQLSYLRGLKYQRMKSKQGGARLKSEDDIQDTAEKLAEEFKVSVATIKRDAVFVEGLEKMDDDLKDTILAGTTKVEKKVIQQLAKTTVESPVRTVEELQQVVQLPKPSDYKTSLKGRLKASVLASTGKALYLTVTGEFLLNNQLVDAWIELRNLPAQTMITVDYQEKISLLEAEELGMISKL